MTTSNETPQTLFLEGPAGTGKTSAGIQRLRELLTAGVQPENILVLLPQRTLARPYQVALTTPDAPDIAGVDMLTISGLARRGIELFWTLVARQAGFANPHKTEPTFLNIETAQYFMTRFVDPAIDEGKFDGVSVPRTRIITQILDNLEKAALNSLTIEEVFQRLGQSWAGPSSRLTVYQDALRVAQAFRAHCLKNNLLDFSLQIDVLTRHLLGHTVYREYLRDKYHHLIVDNIEEMPPVAHDFIRNLLEHLQSALLMYDSDGGFRLFLGADPTGGHELRQHTEGRLHWADSYTQHEAMKALDTALHLALDTREGPVPKHDLPGDPITAFQSSFHSFYPQMLEWASHVVIDLVNQGVEPNQIVMLAPYLNDSLRFTVMNRLEGAGIPVISHRPSRAIREEPAARAMLSLLQWVNPLEGTTPSSDDMLDTWVTLLDGLDPIRASLLNQIVYGIGWRELGGFDQINPVMQKRITYSVGERYEYLRHWMLAERERVSTTPPDYFLRRLFGDVASQRGFGFHTNLDAGHIVAQMIDSAYHFRQVLYPNGVEDWSPVWIQYRQLVSEGLLAALSDRSWQKDEHRAVFIAPAYTFLVRNRTVRYQIWLDVGSSSWWERLNQPLTHPYVVQRAYPAGQAWTDDEENQRQWAMLRRVVLGLTRRCTDTIYLAVSDLGEQGFEQRGPLLRVFQQVLQAYGYDGETGA
jgi:hypothetical protein